MIRRLMAVALLGAGCASMAINAAPKKKANPVQSAFSKKANDAFWAALHGGHYADIPRVKELLQRAYMEDPFDAVTTAHLGFLHVWKISERGRLEQVQASITDEMLLSQRYFHEAVEMTDDPRFMGFLAGAELANGTIHKDEKLIRQGYFRMKDAVERFPEFNLFARGYGGSAQPVDSERFKKGLEDMWANVEFCFGERVKRDDPDYAPVMHEETTVGPKRVCWNGWIAPHNHEGFALNLGDYLVRAGDKKAAKRMYENAKLSKTYGDWPYREVLEKRLEQLDENAVLWSKPSAEWPKDRQVMFGSTFSCGGCHEGTVPVQTAAR